MQEPTHDKMKIRRFLLDEVEDEREQLEELFLTDSNFQEEVLMAEHELIDDYLSGELGADREKFQQLFESNPTQQTKLRVAQTVYDYARTEFAGASRRRKKSYVYLAIAAAVLISVLGGLWLVRQTSFKQEAIPQNNARADIEKQLMAANEAAAGSIESPEAKVTPLVLASVSTRAAGSETTLSLASGAEAFDLWLLPTTTEYESYNATLRKIGSHDQFNLPRLHAQTATQGRLVRLRVPAKLFGRGVYEVALTAVATNGQPIDAGRFTFQITD
jgi:hypothetical protein